MFALLLYVGIATPSPTNRDTDATEQGSQVLCPAAPEPLFKGEQGAQQSAIKFKPATRQVTIKLHVEDSEWIFLPNCPDNFVVYEDGVRQKTRGGRREHAPVSIALLNGFWRGRNMS